MTASKLLRRAMTVAIQHAQTEAMCRYLNPTPDPTGWERTITPDVVEALADWLEQHADEHSTYDCEWDTCAAVTLARTLLGEETTSE